MSEVLGGIADKFSSEEHSDESCMSEHIKFAQDLLQNQFEGCQANNMENFAILSETYPPSSAEELFLITESIYNGIRSDLAHRKMLH